MSNFRSRYGDWALVLGAAEGLGEAFCRGLARRGINVLMVDRQADKLEAAAAGIAAAFGVQVKSLVLDLAGREAAGRVMAFTEELDCRLYIFNAAYGPVRRFLANTAEELDTHLDVNCRTTLHLSHALARRLAGNGVTGGMVLMSSLAGVWGTNLVAPYGATKAFDWNLGEALHYELREYGIDVLSVCSGAVATPNYLGTRPQYGWPRPKVYEPAFIAEQALRRLPRGGRYFPGFFNRLAYFLFGRPLLRRWGAGVMNRTMRKMYQGVH